MRLTGRNTRATRSSKRFPFVALIDVTMERYSSPYGTPTTRKKSSNRPFRPWPRKPRLAAMPCSTLTDLRAFLRPKLSRKATRKLPVDERNGTKAVPGGLVRSRSRTKG